MSQPHELILHDVRCFHGEQRARLRPITLLVGENSTGKTTFLGCYSVLHSLLSRPWIPSDPIDFNRQPFSMGSFRDIVRSRRGPDGRIDKFRLGFVVAPTRGLGMRPYPLIVTFSEEGSQPVVTSVNHEFRKNSFLRLRRDGSGRTILEIPGSEAAIELPLEEWMWVQDLLWRPDAEDYFVKSDNVRAIADYLLRLFPPKKRRSSRLHWLPEFPPVVPVAPLRSKPKRTYDPVRETASADGEHIPMLMMRLDRTEKGRWSSLHDDLVEFGRGAGLFSDIKVRSHGRNMSDPFQLQVKVRSGSYSNIMDVGYGVSQSLPIIVDVRSTHQRTFLLQQPEVHLHPRAQAGLAELFVDSFNSNQNQFIIETHSDYIIDRIRILVRQQSVRAEDVSILYFEPQRNAVSIHNIGLDGDGNLQHAPGGYRDFFIKETDRLLGFG